MTKQTLPISDEVLKDIKAILFDLDGVIINTEHLHCGAWYAIAQRYGIKGFEFDTYAKHFLGASDRTLAETTFKNAKISLDKVVEEKIDYFLDHLNKIETSDDIQSFIESYGGNLPIIVVSNSSRRECTKILESIGLKHQLNAYFTSSDVENPKPHPDIYKAAYEHLKTQDPKLTTRDVLVIEDSEVGAAAAKAAGIPNVLRRDFGDPDVVNTLNHLVKLKGL